MSGVFYPNPRFQSQRPQPNSTTVQRLLDENASLIQTIVEYQKRGSLSEVYDYEQILHRNLIYLTQLADPSLGTHHLPPPQPPMINGTASTTPVRMPNVTLGQMPAASNAQPRPPQQPPVSYSSVDSANRQQMQPGPPGMAPPHQPQQHQPTPVATPPQMPYRSAGPPPPQSQVGMGAPYGNQPGQPYGASQMSQMGRPPMQHGMPPGMPPNPHSAMMRHQQPSQYGPGTIYQQHQPQAGAMPSNAAPPVSMAMPPHMNMQPMSGMPPGSTQPQMQVPPGYSSNFQG